MKRKLTHIKFILATALFILTSSLLSSFAPPPSKVEGYPVVFGNEPFTFIGIETLTSKEDESPKYYRIVCTEEEESALREMQGYLIRISGRIVSGEKAFEEYGPDVLSDGVIILSSWSKK